MKKLKEICFICGGDTQIKKITYTQEIGGKMYLVVDVPAQVCLRCGEQYLTPETVDAIQKAIEQGKIHEKVEVPVYYFPNP